MTRRPIPRDRLFFAMVLLVLATGCASREGASLPKPVSSAADQNLLTCYQLLEDTLREESRLGLLGTLKKITFQRPVPEIEDIMTRLSETSKQRLEELDELRSLSPDVSAEPDPTHEIGKSITSNATQAGRAEMIEIGGSFGVRFVFLQAQATRMVYAISTAGAEIEPNRKRAEWLTKLATEYEGYRDELVVIVEKYILQQGAVKPQ